MTNTVDYVFDATQHDPDTGIELVPAGAYMVAIDSTEIKDLSDNKGQMFNVGFVITDGEYKGRKIFNNYNMWHKQSPQACEIAHKQLSALCHVTGRYQVDFRDGGRALVGAALRLRVDNDGKYNSLKEVYDVNGNKPGRSGAPAGPATTAPVAAATPGVAPAAFTQPAPAAPAGNVAPAAPAYPAAASPAPASVAPAAPAPAAPVPAAVPAAAPAQPVAAAPGAMPAATPPWGATAA